MRFKNSLEDYDTVVIRSLSVSQPTELSKKGRPRNVDAITAIKLLVEENLVALHVVGEGYTKPDALEATLNTLTEAQGVAKSTSINHEVYLVRLEYYDAFRAHFGSKRHEVKKQSYKKKSSLKKSKTVKIQPKVRAIPTQTTNIMHVKPVVANTPVSTQNWKSNSMILNEIKAVFNLATDYSHLDLSNYKSSYYYQLMRTIIADNLKTDRDKINFQDYLSVSDIDNKLHYIIQEIIS